MRGTAGFIIGRYIHGGITPAHAGNSAFSMFGRVPVWDHPRTCGEQLCDTYGKRKSLGSPPHMRGTGALMSIGSFMLGITPAHAGNSGIDSRRAEAPKDHPRTCGEQLILVQVLLFLKGSPPHMRGTDTVGDGGRCDGGITPAHAGNSKRNAKRKLFS